VRSVTGNGEIQTTKAFVRQVVEKIQRVIEAKLTPAQPFPNPILSSAYPGLSYQAPSFYPAPYANVSLPQAAYAFASVPQPYEMLANLLQSSHLPLSKYIIQIGDVGFVT